MPRIAVVDNATSLVVSEWIGGDDQVLAPKDGCVYITLADDAASVLGMTWTGSAFVPATTSITLEPLDFMRLFTQAERIAIRTAAAGSGQLRDWYDQLTFARRVRLDHPEIVAGLQALQGAGLLTAARVTAILAGQPPA